jgi:hypothetical protein
VLANRRVRVLFSGGVACSIARCGLAARGLAPARARVLEPGRKAEHPVGAIFGFKAWRTRVAGELSRRRDMSRADRGFLLFLVLALVVLLALFYELFPRHAGEPQAPTAQAPAGPASTQQK